MNVQDLLNAQAAVNRQLAGAPAPAVPLVVQQPQFTGSAPEASYLGGSPAGLPAALNHGVSRPTPTLYAEVDRILKLPVLSWLSPQEEEEFNRRHVLAHVYERGWRYLNTQSNAIAAYEKYGGLFGIIAVGWGKTLIALKCSDLALAKGHRRVLHLLPASTTPQLMDTDIGWARRHVPMSIPFFSLHGKTRKARKAIAKSGKRGSYVMPYSLLSQPDALDIVQWIDADLIVCDEVHRIGDHTAARTQRWMRYVRERRPEVVALSGSVTDKGPSDYAHIIAPALNDNSPVPHSKHLMNEWNAVLGSRNGQDRRDGAPTTPIGQGAGTGTATLAPLIEWARAYFPHYNDRLQHNQEGFRLAYQMRLTTAPGVVATGDNEIGVSLCLANLPVQNPEASPGWDHLQDLIETVEVVGETPTGDVIEHAIHAYKWLYELSAGFYNNLVWPHAEKVARVRNMPLQTAQAYLQGALDHHAAKQEYASKLRKFLRERHRPGLDTPMLVGNSMYHHGPSEVGVDLWHAWDMMRRLEFEGMPERESSPVRVCPFKVDAAVEWAREFTTKGRGGIIWVWNEELGLWAYEKLIEAGLAHALHCPAGDAYNTLITDTKTKDRVIVASIKAHGEGKNLQHHRNQLFLQWPRSVKAAQQTLGRLHRTGQKAEALVAHRMDTSEFDRMVFAACLVDAVYVQQTTGGRQKIVVSDYDPMPKLFPPEFLRERGFQNKLLDHNQQDLLRGGVVA